MAANALRLSSNARPTRQRPTTSGACWRWRRAPKFGRCCLSPMAVACGPARWCGSGSAIWTAPRTSSASSRPQWDRGGRKDRNVMLPADVPGPLRQWWKERPRRQDKDVAPAERCRTAALGGHVKRCEDCAHEPIAYNSCRNRHCPKCQGAAAKDWLAARSNLHSPDLHRPGMIAEAPRDFVPWRFSDAGNRRAPPSAPCQASEKPAQKRTSESTARALSRGLPCGRMRRWRRAI